MNPRPVILRQRAHQDVEATVRYLATEASPQVATRFIDALEQATIQLSQYPASGSLRLAFTLDLPGLPVWPIRDWPYWVFYVAREDHIDVWRVLHGQRDIPESLQSVS